VDEREFSHVKVVVTDMSEMAEVLSVNEGTEAKETLEVKELKRLKLKEMERLKLKEEVSWSSKIMEAEVRLTEVLEWLVADPQVCALWPQLARQLGLPGQVPLLAVTRPGRSSDSQRLAALLTIWPRLSHLASLPQLCRALNDIGLRHAAEFLDLLYSNRRQSNACFKTGEEQYKKLVERNRMKALDRRCLSDSGISLASTASITARWPGWSHNNTAAGDTPRKDIFRLDFTRGLPFKSFSGSCESSFRLSNPDDKLNWSVQDLMAKDINGIECLQNGISMHDRSNQICPNSGEFCSNVPNIRDSSNHIQKLNQCPHQKPKRDEKGGNYFESKQEGRIDEVGLVLAQSGSGQNANFLNQDECDQTLSKLYKSESGGEVRKENCQMKNDTKHVSPKVQEPKHNSSVLENHDSCESRQEKTSEEPSSKGKDLTKDQRPESTDPVLDFRVQSPEDGYFSNKEDTLENLSPVKNRSPGVIRVENLEKDCDSMLDSSLEMDSSLQTSPKKNKRGIQNQNPDRLVDSSSEIVGSVQEKNSELAKLASNTKLDLDSSLETFDDLLQSQPSELAQVDSKRERNLDSSWQSDDSQQTSLSKIQEIGSNMKSPLESNQSDQIQLSPKTEELSADKIDSLLQTSSLSTSLDSLAEPKTNERVSPPTPKTAENLEKSSTDDKNRSCSLQTGEAKHPISHSSPKLHHDEQRNSDLKTSSSSLEELPSMRVINSDEREAALLRRGLTIRLDETSVSFDERGHIVPCPQEADVFAGARQERKGVFETLFRPDPRYWPKLLAAGWTRRGRAREERSGCSRYATIRGFLKRRHSLSRVKRGKKGEVGFYFDNLVTILKAAVVGI